MMRTTVTSGHAYIKAIVEMVSIAVLNEQRMARWVFQSVRMQANTSGGQHLPLAPGLIDTDMQSELRAGDPGNFPEREAFVRMKETGALTSPADAAKRVLAYLDRDDFGGQPVADVRDTA